MSRIRSRSPANSNKKNIFETSKISILVDTKTTPRIHSGTLTTYDTTPTDSKKRFSYENSILYPMKKVEKLYRRMVKTRENGTRERTTPKSVDNSDLVNEKGKK